MRDDPIPIPPPPVVRRRLARNIRERRLLQSLLRLSIRASQEGAERGGRAPEEARDGDGPDSGWEGGAQ
jgi:hypothetical protein